MINEIIKFYQSFNRYKDNTDEEIHQHLIQCINNNQYKLFKDEGIYGFTNWAFVNQQTEDYFLKTGIIEDWNCGDIMLHIDFIATKNIRQIMSWLKNNSVNDNSEAQRAFKKHIVKSMHIAETLGLNKTIHWARLDNDNKIRKIMKQNTKDSWSWVV